jgi:DNA-binding SARP family transcriptional activator
MSSLNIRLFGKLCVHSEGQALRGLDACKVQELFTYLLLHHDRPHSRETLSGLLWADASTEKSKKYLRQALWQLQTWLDAPSSASVLTVEHDWVQFNSQAPVWLDVAVFERAFTLAHGSSGSQMDERCTEALHEAVGLYRGDLLEGWYQDWCLYERERLQNMYLSMLDKLMSHCEAHREFEKGILYGTLILRHDRARERTHRQLMSLYYLSGDRTAALRQYGRCVAALREELDVKPDKRTGALYQQIRADQLEASTHAPPEVAGDEETAPVSLPELLGRLKQLQAMLADVQQRVHRDIRAVELALGDARRISLPFD